MLMVWDDNWHNVNDWIAAEIERAIELILTYTVMEQSARASDKAKKEEASV